MEIKAVKFRTDGFYTQPFVFGGEEGAEKFDPKVRYRGSLQIYLIDTGDDVILVDTGLPAGTPDEVPEETAERETYEETGIRIKLIGERFPRESDFIRPLGIQRNYRDDITHVDIIYAAVPYDETLLTVDHNESYTAGWFSREDLDHMEVFPDVKITMDYILENMIH